MKKRWRIVADAWREAESPVERVAVDVEGERIVQVAPARDLPSSSETVTFPSPALLIPAFHDSHTHLLTGALSLDWVSLAGIQSVGEAAARLEEGARQSDGRWLEAYGFREGVLPLDRKMLDRIVPDIPVFVRSRDLHSAVVNSKAFSLAGVTEQTADPPRGHFDRGPDGKLNGFIREGACGFLLSFRPALERTHAQRALLRAQSLAFSLGITAAGVSTRKELIPFYLDFAQSSQAKLRINLWKVAANFDYQTERFEQHDGSRFRFATFKGFVDGTLSSQSAALWEPYTNNPRNTGVLLASEEELASFVRKVGADGFQVALHAIGDRACTVALNAFEAAGMRDSRMRLEHAQVMRKDDVHRLADLGVVASMQPTHATGDMKWAEERIGSRTHLSYAWRSIRDAGARLCFGSDWPVETMSPMAGLHAATTRQDEHGNPPGGWNAQQCLTVEEALEAYTQGGAYGAYWEDELGTISEGKSADLAVLSCNPFTDNPRELLNAKILMTVCDGEVVYRDDSMPSLTNSVR